jgi:hypothetical protein
MLPFPLESVQARRDMTRKIETPKNYSGLTVNERLYVSGMLDKFDDAARNRNRDTMISMLQHVALPENYAARWVDTLLGDNTFFYR